MVSRPFSNTASFALSRRQPLPESNALFGGPVSPGGLALPGSSRWLLVSVEPVEPTPHAWALAQRCIEAIRAGFAAAHEAPIPQALARGFASANAMIRSENRGVTARRHGQRVLIGASAVAIEGDRLYVMQVPPTQTLLCQDRLIYALPSLQSWEPHYGGNDRETAEPLGAREQVDPEIFQTIVAPKDVVILCSTSLGKTLARIPELAGPVDPPRDPAGRPLPSLPVNPGEKPFTMLDLGPLRPAGTEPARAWADWLRSIAEEHNIPESHAIAAAVGELDIADEPRGPLGFIRSVLGQPEQDEVGPSDLSFVPPTADSRLDEIVAAAEPRHDDQADSHVSAPVVPARAFSLGALPGAHGVQRFREAKSISTSPWRAFLPRLAIGGPGGIPIPVFLLATVLVIVGIGFGVNLIRSELREREIAEMLAEADRALALAEAEPWDADKHVVVAREQVLSAHEAGATPTEITPRFLRVQVIEDRIAGVLRLQNPVRIGGLPEDITRTSGTAPHLVQGADGVYLVADALYRLNPQSGHLVQLLRPGDLIEGRMVEPLRDAVPTRAGMAATDGRTLFLMSPGGTWSAEPLDDALNMDSDAIAAAAILDGQMAIVEAGTGRLVVIELPGEAIGGQITLPAQLSGTEVGVIDLATDDGFFALLRNGNLLEYSETGHVSETALPVQPGITQPRALTLDQGGVWVLDGGSGEGRLTWYDNRSRATTTYLLPAPEIPGDPASAPLATATDFAIEGENQVYFLADGAIWVAEIPEPSETT